MGGGNFKSLVVEFFITNKFYHKKRTAGYFKSAVRFLLFGTYFFTVPIIWDVLFHSPQLKVRTQNGEALKVKVCPQSDRALLA